MSSSSSPRNLQIVSRVPRLPAQLRAVLLHEGGAGAQHHVRVWPAGEVQCSKVVQYIIFSTELLLALIRFESIFSLGPIYTQTYELTEFIFATQTFKPFKPTFIYSTSQVLYVKAVVFKRLNGYDIFISTNKQSGYELFFPTNIF